MTEAQVITSVFATSALAAVEAHIANRNQRFADAVAHTAEDIAAIAKRMKAELERDTRERDLLLAGGLAQRPARRMPMFTKVARFHNLPTPPACIRCDFKPGVATWGEASSHLQRAHIIDRAYGGLDSLCNILPLCPPCHREQPIFRPQDRAEALEWFGISQ